MALTKRITKGSALTATEHDANLDHFTAAIAAESAARQAADDDHAEIDIATAAQHWTAAPGLYITTPESLGGAEIPTYGGSVTGNVALNGGTFWTITFTATGDIAFTAPSGIGPRVRYVDVFASGGTRTVTAPGFGIKPNIGAGIAIPSGETARFEVWNTGADNVILFKPQTPADITASVAAATLTAAGKVEIATGSETTAGADAGRAVSPDGLRSSDYGGKELGGEICGSGTALTVGDGTSGVSIPFTMNGMDIIGVRVSAHTAGTGTGTNDFQIRRRRAGTNADVLTTKVTLGPGEFTVADGVIGATNDDLASGDLIYCDTDAITSGPPSGVSWSLVAKRPAP